MADLVFTETARLHIQAIFATMPSAVPIVMVGWLKGMWDNLRSPDGSVVWTQAEDAGWYAVVADWVDMEAGPDDESTLPSEEIQGLRVHVDHRARSAPGTLRISLTEEGLAVEHLAS